MKLLFRDMLDKSSRQLHACLPRSAQQLWRRGVQCAGRIFPNALQRDLASDTVCCRLREPSHEPQQLPEQICCGRVGVKFQQIRGDIERTERLADVDL